MNGTLHQIAGSIVDQTVSCECIFTGKYGSPDNDSVMASVACPRMTGVQTGFVNDLQALRMQAGQSILQYCSDSGTHPAGKAFLNGLTVTD